MEEFLKKTAFNPRFDSYEELKFENHMKKCRETYSRPLPVCHLVLEWDKGCAEAEMLLKRDRDQVKEGEAIARANMWCKYWFSSKIKVE